MLIRANVYCTLISSPRQVKAVASYGSGLIQYHGSCRPSQRVSVKALKEETGDETSVFRGQRRDPGFEIEVPFEQRPVNEYSSLKHGVLYSWGELGPGEFFLRLGGLWLVTFTVLGMPIAAASFNPSREPLRFVLAAGTGTLFLVSLITLRIYLASQEVRDYTYTHAVDYISQQRNMCTTPLRSCMLQGWSYVGDRLLSAVVPYEASGWHDGQMWVKPSEVLARDRLLGSYKVKPVVKLLKQTLVGTGALLVAAALLFIFATPVEDFLRNTFTTKENPSNVALAKVDQKFNLRKEELLKLPVEVMSADDLAAAAAEATDGRPVYCRDRFYRALAGGRYRKMG